MDQTNAQFWEDLYAVRTPQTDPRPNAAFVDVCRTYDLAPGRALDLGAGPGGDALWLAAQGWHVTATDVSTTAARRLQRLADQRDLSRQLRATRHDLVASLPTSTYDLVYACYFHTPIDIDRSQILRRAADLLGVGGTLIVVDHASTAPWSWAAPDTQYPTPEQTYAGIGLDQDWQPLLLAARDRDATGPEGQIATVADNIILARRVNEPAFSARAEAENHRRRHPDPRL